MLTRAFVSCIKEEVLILSQKDIELLKLKAAKRDRWTIRAARGECKTDVCQGTRSCPARTKTGERSNVCIV